MALGDDLDRILAKIGALQQAAPAVGPPDVRQLAAQRLGQTVASNRRRLPAPKLGALGNVLAQQGPRFYNRAV